jgi:hypothetical protein
MRREGFEFAVSKAEVLYHTDENGKKLEPMELAYIDVPNEFAGAVIEKLGQRKGELRNMGSISGGTYTRLEFSIPARGLIGYRGEFMTDTKGNGILNTVFNDYGPYKGDIQYRKMGSLIAFESGESITYGLYNAQERGTLFIGPGEKVYSGMVIGQTGRSEDIEINVCKKKQLTNTRSSSADEALGRIQDLLTDTKVCGSYLQQFVGIDEVQSLLQRQDFGRCQTQSFVSAGGTGVGQLLLLADIDLDVLTASGLTDDHTGVYLFTGPDEESTTLLSGEQTVSYGFAGFESNQGTKFTISNISLVWSIAIENGIDDTISFGVG